MHKFITMAAALAVGTMWSLGPASAQTTTDRMERKAERAADKAERAADKAERSAEKAADHAADKAEGAKDTIKDKAEHAKDTIKDKAVRAKDTMKEKVAQAKDKIRSKTEQANDRVAMSDTRAAQEALKTQGFDPGPIDGRMGPRTRAAITDYQRKNELPATGMLDDATMSKLNVRSSRATDVPAASPATQPDPKKQTQ
jgi:peptidoglycan hydrolase-like protein with peptidoglycan-binding domain